MGLDYVLFDTAPSVGGIQERPSGPPTWCWSRQLPEFLSADGARKICDSMMTMQKEKEWKGKILGILPTFYDEQTRESKTQLDEYRKIFKELVMQPIHRAPSCANARRRAGPSSRSRQPPTRRSGLSGNIRRLSSTC